MTCGILATEVSKVIQSLGGDNVWGVPMGVGGFVGMKKVVGCRKFRS